LRLSLSFLSLTDSSMDFEKLPVHTVQRQ
jgi:hypothetical protein